MKPHPSAADCAQLRDLLPAYTFGLTDADETRLVEMLLPLCPAAAAELPIYQALAERMTASAPLVEPPAHLLTSILRAASDDETSLAPTTMLPKPIHLGSDTPASLLQTTPPRIIRLSSLLGGIAAVLIGVLLALNVWTLTRVFQLFETSEVQSELLGLFATEDILTFELVDQREDVDPTTPRAQGAIDCNPRRKVALVRVENFPQPSTPDGFQVWLWRNGERFDVGKLKVDQKGVGTLVLKAPDVMGTYQWVGIGSHDAATGEWQPVARGNLYLNNQPSPSPNASEPP